MQAPSPSPARISSRTFQHAHPVPHPLAVLHMTGYVGRVCGGLSRIALGLARAQRDLAMRPTIHCLDDVHGVIRAADTGPVGGLLHVSRPLGPGWIGYSPQGERWTSAPEAGRYQILHQHGIWYAFSRSTNSWRRRWQRPVVVAPQGTLETEALRFSKWKKVIAARLYEGQNLGEAACLQATSYQEAESFRRFGLRNPIAVIANGIDDEWIDAPGDATAFRRALGIRPDRRILLFLSRVHPKKGVPLLLEAYERAGRAMDGWELVIAGPAEDPAYLDALRRRAARISGSGPIHFTGPLLGEMRRNAFAAADVFVLPTLSDNFAMVVAEALGAGVPALVTEGAHPWRILNDERCGWWVPTTPGSLADALRTAAGSAPAELAAMGTRGRVLARRYAWSHIAKQTDALYRWLLGNGRRPAFVLKD